MIRRFQQTPASATCRAMHGERWELTDQLLATVVDVLQVANWQRQGKKNAPRPKRLKRPWEKNNSQNLGSEPIPMSKFASWWNSKRKKER